MTNAERAALETFVEEHFPRMFLELERLKEKNIERYRRRMSRIAPETRRMMEMLEIHPERGALMIQERRLDLQIRQAASRFRSMKNEKNRSRLRKRIRELCAEAFDCRHMRRELEIRELEARIGELKERHARAAEMRKELINRELKERLGQPAPTEPKQKPRP